MWPYGGGGWLIFHLAASLAQMQCDKPITAPSQLLWQIFRQAPFFNVTSSVLHIQDPPCYICRFEAFSFPIYSRGTKGFPLKPSSSQEPLVLRKTPTWMIPHSPQPTSSSLWSIIHIIILLPLFMFIFSVNLKICSCALEHLYKKRVFILSSDHFSDWEYLW